MKYWFIVSMAIFAFAISCAKKENKQGQAGKPGATAALDCKTKDKGSKACEDQEKKAKEAAIAAGKVETTPTRGESGATDAKTELDTIPNLKDLHKMSLTLSNQTALIAEIKTSAENETGLATRIVCTDLKDLDKEKSDVINTDPDDLKTVQSHIYLFNNSSIVGDLKVNVGDTTKPTKLYMLTCKSGSSATVDQYKEVKTVATKLLKKGQMTFESVALDGKVDVGVLTSFECNDDEQILKDSVKKIGNKATNRLRLRKGSAVFVLRAGEQKVGDKKLNELGSEAQKLNKHSIISCEG
jgi:hypothetical protein